MFWKKTNMHHAYIERFSHNHIKDFPYPYNVNYNYTRNEEHIQNFHI